MSKPFTLTSADRDSPLWRSLEAHMKEQRENLRAANDRSGLPLDKTEFLRGGIAQLTALLDLSTDRSKRMT